MAQSAADPSGTGDLASPAASQALQLHDARPFLDKVLVHGVARGIIGRERLEAIHLEAPKGIVQIARHFGSEFLRPELEKARDRLINLVSLHLLDSTDGDLDAAAAMLRDHSLLSRSKAGSDMLRRLIAMPESSNFGLAGPADAGADVAMLALWSLRSHAEYRAELARRTAIGEAIGAARWWAAQADLDDDELEAAGADAEAVIRTGLLLQALGAKGAALDEWPTAAALEKRVSALRKRGVGAPDVLPLPVGLPGEIRAVAQSHVAGVLADIPRLLDPAVPLRTLLRPLGAFRARYFLLDDPLAEIDGYHRSLDAAGHEDEADQPASKTWIRATQGHEDEPALLTLFLCLAAGLPKKTLLTEKTAASLIRRIRKSGWDPALATAFVRAHAAGSYQSSYCALWDGFVQEAGPTLRSDRDERLHDALALLRRECHVAG